MSIKACLQPSARGPLASTALLIVRLTAGSAFVLHGWPKMHAAFSWMGPHASIPPVFQFLAAISEFCGGIAWIVGIATPLASFGIACTMATAVYTVAVVWHAPFVSPTGGMSWELAAAYFGIALLLLTSGPGRFSADQALVGGRE